MVQKNTPLSRRIIGALGSRHFFQVIIGLFCLQAAWIALAGRYPMAFDEDFHLGIIRLYAHHTAPFWAGQPESADKFGAVARDPSYLYHYLFSFPYRLISLFTANQTIQVIILRFLNIGLFAGGLVLFRKLFLKSGISRAAIHLTLLIFILIPVVPLLAAQINYDNLLFPLTAMALLLAIRFDGQLTNQKRLDLKSLLQLLVVCLLTSLVKYAFLPLFIGIVVFIVVRLWLAGRSKSHPQLSIAKAWQRLSGWLRIGLVVSVLLASTLFVERYGLNLVHYHTPIPDCSKVLRVEQCREYGPWIRDYNLEIAKVSGPRSPLAFTYQWLYGMWLRLFFAIGGPTTDYESRGPLVLPGLGAVYIGGSCLLILVVRAKRLWRQYNAPLLTLFILTATSYTGLLWLDEYRAFLHTGQPVAINGRYLLPILAPIMLLAATAVAELLKQWQAIKLVLAVTVVLCMAWGGGVLTYMLRSNDNWYWPNPAAKSANHAVQAALGPITPGFYQQSQFLHWQ